MRHPSIVMRLAFIALLLGTLLTFTAHADTPTAPAASEPAPVVEAGDDNAAPEPEAAAADEPHSVNASLPHDLSPMGMYRQADWVVKAVMLGLLFASVVTWTVWAVKALQLMTVKRHAKEAVQHLQQAKSLKEALLALQSSKGAIPMLAKAAQHELHLSSDRAMSKDGVKERTFSRLQDIEAITGRQLNQGTGLLATIGSTAPFVGLFGTVWGIMNSFIGIAAANTTNLAVVAPGIAEALLATAIGLFAAIPAVIIYNHFARGMGAFRGQLGNASSEVLRLVSRDLDRGDMGAIEKQDDASQSEAA